MRLGWKKARDEGRIGPRTLRKIFAALHEGKSLRNLNGRYGSKYVGGSIVSSQMLSNFIKKNPRVGKKIRELGEANVRRLRVPLGERRRLIAAPAILRNDGADAYEAITRATVSLWEGERGDVMSLMFLAIAEGRLMPRHAEARMQEFL
jgi:hypothetical protein